jgi:hypothetical protein
VRARSRIVKASSRVRCQLREVARQSAEGGFGPQLAGGAAVQKFPNAADQATFVQAHTLPPFRDRLRAQEIRDLVEYTRSLR